LPDQPSSEEIYRGKLITLRILTLPQPSGGTSRFEIVDHPDAVAIVALRYNASDGPNAEPQTVLVHQYRPAIGKKTWEIPAGMVELNEREAPQVTAARELREETGYLANRWQRLIREYTSPGFSNEAITIYLATEVYPDGPAADVPDDPTEIAQVRWLPLSEAVTLCRNGEIEDGKTILGLYLVQNMLMSKTTAT